MPRDNSPPPAGGVSPPGGGVSPPARGTAIAVVIATAVAIAAPIAERWEGYAAKPYLDPARIKTYCYGETDLAKLIAGHVYAKSECGKLLRERLARDYAPRILKCLPELAEPRRAYVFAALLDASYNAGPAAVCKSRMAIEIRRERWRSACDALPSWYVGATYRGSARPAAAMRAQGWRWTGTKWFKKFPGLVNRRNDERRVCLMGAAQGSPS